VAPSALVSGMLASLRPHYRHLQLRVACVGVSWRQLSSEPGSTGSVEGASTDFIGEDYVAG